MVWTSRLRPVTLTPALGTVGAVTGATMVLLALVTSEPANTLLATGAVLLAAMAATGLFAWAARDPNYRTIWAVLAAAGLAFTIAEAYWFVVEGVLQQEVGLITFADACYLAGYALLMLAGILALPGRPRAVVQVRVVLDFLIVFISLSAIAWILFAHHTDIAMQGQAGAGVLVMMYPLLDLILLGFLLFMLRTARPVHRARIVLFALAVVSWSVVDSSYASQAAHEGFASGLPIDAFWVGGYAALGLAAVVRPLRSPATDRPGVPTDLQGWNWAIYVPVLILIPLAAIYVLRTGPIDGILFIHGLVLVSALVTRQVLFARELTTTNRELTDEKARLAHAQATARLGTWTLDLRTRQASASKEVYRIFDRPDDPSPFIFEEGFGMLPRDVSDEVLEAYARILKEGGTYERDLEFTLPDGRTKTLILHAHRAPGQPEGGALLEGTLQDITERKAAEEANRFQANLLDSVGDAVMATDDQGNITYWNSSAETLYGWSKDEVLGRPITEVTPTEATKEQAEEIFAELMQGRSWAGEFNVRRKDGSSFPAYIRDDPIMDDDGRLVGVIGISRDITERKRLETDLGERVKELQALSELAQKGTAAKTAGDVLRATVACLEPAFVHADTWVRAAFRSEEASSDGVRPDGPDLTSRFRVGPDDGRIEVRYRQTHEAQDIGPFLQEEQDMMGAMTEQVAALIGRLDALEELQKRDALLTEAQTIAQLGSWELDLTTDELSWSDEVYRIFEVDPDDGPLSYEKFLQTVHPDDREAVDHMYQNAVRKRIPYQKEHRLLLPDGRTKYVREQGDTRYESGRPVRTVGTVQDITIQKESEEELHFRAHLLASVSQAVIATDVDGIVTYWNPVAETMFGWTLLEAVGRPITDLWGAEQTLDQSATNSAPAARAGDYRLPRKDGTPIIARLATSPLLSPDGTLQGFISIVQDVTEQRAVEQRFQDVVETSPAGIYRTSWDGRILLANPEYARIAGYPSVEALMAEVDTTSSLYADPAERDRILRLLDEYGELSGHEFQVLRKDGMTRWVRATVRPETTPDGERVLSGFVEDIEEERRIHQRFQDLVENSPNAIFRTTHEGEIEYVNPAGARMFGYDDPDQFITELGPVENMYADPEDRKTLLAEIQKDTPGPLEFRFKRRDGSTFWGETRAAVQTGPDGRPVIEGTLRDLTAERERHAVTTQLAAIVTSSQEALYTKDLDGMIQTWNHGAEELYGYSADEAVGKNFADLAVPPDRMAEYHVLLDRIRHGRPIERHDNVRRRKDGSLVEISLSITPLRGADGKVFGASVSAYDISDRKAAEDAEKARQETQKIKEVDQKLRDFINAAAHDLNQPLTPMKLAMHGLKNQTQDQDEKTRRLMDMVSRSVDRMELLVQDLLDVARIEAGTLKLAPAKARLADLVEETEGFFSVAAQEKGIRLVHEGDAEVVLDGRRTMQVLFNLVGNAMKFTPKDGSITTTVKDEAAGIIRVEVTDTGAGLTDDQMGRLFQPFSQVHTNMPNAPKGTGLGLYISKGIVRQHGGDMGVQSDGPGKGATFWFTLPVDGPPSVAVKDAEEE